MFLPPNQDPKKDYSATAVHQMVPRTFSSSGALGPMASVALVAAEVAEVLEHQSLDQDSFWISTTKCAKSTSSESAT